MTAETKPSSPVLAHRDDIDGLRAVAVVPVVLFHAGIPWFSGGFVGVDVFFVISGYLITSIIVRELLAGRFTLTNFYERRVRRIFPALFTVIFATFVVCTLFFLPREYEEFAESAAGAAVFVSNLVFWQAVDYFGLGAEMKPLLHTWSLAIEEQYYIGFPLALMLLFRIAPRLWRPFVVVVLLISLGLCIWGTPRYPVATFYLAPTRAWELMIGSVLASGLVPRPTARSLRELLAALGIALILASVFLLDERTAFPGAWALAPCLGAALVILAGSTGPTRIGRLLALRPVVFVGLVSYSLYLWHWPLLVFARYVLVREPRPWEMAGVIALSFLLSVLSWRYVEQPFRHRRPPTVARKPLFAGALVAMALVATAGLTVSALAGLPGRLDPRAVAWAEQAVTPEAQLRCRTMSEAYEPRCRIGAAEGEESFVLWGDSKALMLIPGIEEAAERAGRRGVVASRPGCAPVLGVRPARGPDGCAAFNESVARWIEARPRIETLVLAGYWRRQATGESWNDHGVLFLDDQSREPSAPENAAVFERGLERILARLRQREIWIVDDAPEASRNVPSTLGRLVALGRDPADWSASFPLSRVHAERRTDREIFRGLAARHGFGFVEVDDLLCPDGRCPLTLEGRAVYRDGDHLSPFGARLLTDRLAIVFDAGR